MTITYTREDILNCFNSFIKVYPKPLISKNFRAIKKDFKNYLKDKTKIDISFGYNVNDYGYVCDLICSVLNK